MSQQIVWGIMLVLVGGFLNGSFAAPMKRLSAWRWENIWMVYSVSGLLILPWILSVVTVPHLGGVFQQSSGHVLAKVAVFGFGWGIGAVLLGQGIPRVGMALAFAIDLGVTSTFGSLLPLMILYPNQLGTRHGLALIAGTLVMIVGLVFLTVAGKRREREQSSGAAASGQGGFVVGLVICILAGIFSACLNFAFIFGEEMRQLALHEGASQAMAANGIWALAVTSGFVPNACICIYLLNKNHTWGVFRQATAGTAYVMLGSLMGVLWYIGTVVYGMGAASLGALGGILGWPVYMSMDIIAGVFWGFLGGEWKGVSRTALVYCLTGIAILFLAIGVISFGSAS